MLKILREPLLHFLLLGMALFWLYGLVGNQTVDTKNKIIVTRGQMQQLIVGFTRTWQRPPTEKELNGLVDDFIREDILYRTAKNMGLDEDDTIVRRRMRQKLEFLTEDLATQSMPNNQELQAYLSKNANQYLEEPKITFEQIFFNNNAKATSILAKLNSNKSGSINLNTVGDASLLPFELKLMSQSNIAQLFGEQFGEKIIHIKPGSWVGPIESNYGTHLIFVQENISSKLPDLSSIHNTVLNDFLAERRKQVLENFYKKLQSQYTIIVE